MIDSLLHYDTTTRAATLDEILAELEPMGYAVQGEDGLVLDASRCFVVELVSQQAEWDYTDPEAPILLKPRVTLPGIALWICNAEGLDETLWALSGNVCRLQADRDKADAGDPHYIIRTRLDAATLSSVSVEPVIAGSNYPFGGA